MNKQLIIGGSIVVVFVLLLVLVMKKEHYDIVSGVVTSSGTGIPTVPTNYITSEPSGNIGISNNGEFNNLNVDGSVTLRGYPGNVGDVMVSNGSSAPVWASLNFPSKQEQNGYVTLPGGVIIQWGYLQFGTHNVTFPIPFPSNCFNVTLSPYIIDNMWEWPGAGNVVVTTNITRTGFNTISQTPNAFFWTAIGN